MEPTAAELLAITSIDTLADWALLSDVAPPIAPPLLVAPPSPRASFLAHLGMTGMGPAHFRVLAILDVATFAAAIAAWQYLGAAPSLALVASANLLHVTARRICLLDPWPAAAAAHAAAVAAAGIAPPLPAAGQIRLTTSVKLSQVIDQTMDADVPYIADPIVMQMHQRYVTVMGEPPTPDVAATEEQLSAIGHILDAGRCPYADFSLFGPHGTRLLRRLKLRGLSLDGAGQFKSVEMFGPSDHGLWDACWEVFTTCSIMHDAILRITLAKYQRRIAHYAKRFGSSVWHILYQADVRARSELWPRKRVEAITEHNRLIAAALPTTFDPARPWDHPLALVCSDVEFWRTEVEEPCWFVMTKLNTLGANVDGDAPVASPTVAPTAGGRISHGERTRPLETPPPPPRRVQQRTTNHLVDAAGLATHNRAGVRLCPAYLAGTCSNTSHACPNGAHQCSRCLQHRHVCATPGTCSAPLREPRSTKGGKAKGKGKGGKKGGKRH